MAFLVSFDIRDVYTVHSRKLSRKLFICRKTLIESHRIVSYRIEFATIHHFVLIVMNLNELIFLQ